MKTTLLLILLLFVACKQPDERSSRCSSDQQRFALMTINASMSGKLIENNRDLDVYDVQLIHEDFNYLIEQWTVKTSENKLFSYEITFSKKRGELGRIMAMGLPNLKLSANNPSKHRPVSHGKAQDQVTAYRKIENLHKMKFKNCDLEFSKIIIISENEKELIEQWISHNCQNKEIKYIVTFGAEEAPSNNPYLPPTAEPFNKSRKVFVELEE